jgi:excisionase family DNA binding protein
VILEFSVRITTAQYAAFLPEDWHTMTNDSGHPTSPLNAVTEKDTLKLKEWLIIQEVADLLRVSRDTVERWVNSGCLKAVDISSNHKGFGHRRNWRINKKCLEGFLEARSNRTPLPVRKKRPSPKPDVIEFIK